MRALLAAGLFVSLAFAGCLSDGLSGIIDDFTVDVQKVPGTSYVGSHPAYGFPVYGFDDPTFAGWNDAWSIPEARELPSELGRLEYLTNVGDVPGGAGIAVFGHHAFVGGTSGPLSVVDIRDPLNPSVVATLDVPMRDAETIAFPTGKLLLVSTDGSTVALTDVTDPTNPEFITDLGVTNGAHNVAVLPGTPLYYNSPSGGTTTDIWDLSVPGAPELVQQWENGAGCHDIMWHITPDVQRGYCAGLSETQIWDVSDPKEPTIIASIPLPDVAPGVSDLGPLDQRISHLAMVNHDATVLIVGDETGGGALPACDVYVEEPVTGTTESGPHGNLWFYDLTDETNPVFMSQLSPNFFQSHATCTSHFGRLVEETNHVVMSFYGAGVLLVDFNDVANPRIVDQWRPLSADGATPGLTWDVWYYQGYLFTGDILRGMDVLQIAEPLL